MPDESEADGGTKSGKSGWSSSYKSKSDKTRSKTSSGGGVDNTKLMVGGILMACLFAAVSGLYGVIYASQQKTESNNADIIEELESIGTALAAEACPAKSPGTPPNVVTTLKNGVKVLCDSETEGGRWIVFQRRSTGSPSFDKDYNEYAWGFGDLEKGDFWLGLENIYFLCGKLGACELRVDIETAEKKVHAKYDFFYVGCANIFYLMWVDKYSGDAGDVFKLHPNTTFTTKDRDNDESDQNCASNQGGGFWHVDCSDTQASLNNKFNEMRWPTTSGKILSVEMKLRIK